MNGEIECFTGSHMALAVLAILVLMAAFAVTVLMLVANKKWRDGAVSLLSCFTFLNKSYAALSVFYCMLRDLHRLNCRT